MPRRPVLKPHVWQVRSFDETVKALDGARGLATSRRPLSLVTGPAGTGKTFSAEYFQSKRPGVKIAVCPPRDVLSPRSLLQAVAASVGVDGAGYLRAASLLDELVRHLSGSRLFLILDEADRLYASNCDLLRDMAEQADVAICLLGCPGLRATIARVPATHHRIGLSFQIPSVEVKDLKKALGSRYSDETAEEIFEQTAGNIRHLEALLTLLEEAKANDRQVAINPSLVKAVSNRFLLRLVA